MYFETPEKAGRQAGLSITARISALFAGSVFSILLLSVLFLYLNLAQDLHDEDARLLRENVVAIRAAYLASPDPAAVLEDELSVEPGANRAEPFYLRATDADGKVLETAGMTLILPPFAFDQHGARTGAQPARWRSPEGRTFLLYQDIASGARSGTFQGAVDVSADELVLSRYRRVLMVVVLLGTLLAGAAGRFTARHGLRPLARLNRSVQEISARRLDERIGEQAWPSELADLATVFDQMLGRLEDSFGRLSRFSGDLAHELRTPLTNLRGEAEVALQQERSAADYRRVLESSLEEFTRLTDLVDRLLFLARADAGATVLEPQVLDGETEIERVRAFYAALADESGVSVQCAGEGPVVADPLLFRRAVANLLSNALEHTPRGGRIAMELRSDHQGARVRVADTGRGIPEVHLPHVMERFYQAEPTGERRVRGAGLGLALVRSIVELHGGSITLTSEPGLGTQVSLFFPAGEVRSGLVHTHT